MYSFRLFIDDNSSMTIHSKCNTILHSQSFYVQNSLMKLLSNFITKFSVEELRDRFHCFDSLILVTNSLVVTRRTLTRL